VLFKRIFNFTQKEVEAGAKERREDTRYPLGHEFPLKTSVSLLSHDTVGNAIPNSDRDWGALVVNFSRKGANFHVANAASGKRGEGCKIKLTLGRLALEVPAKIAHFKVMPDYAACGLTLQFPDFEVQKAYLQMLEPVIVGASLVKIDPAVIQQNAPGLVLEQYSGEDGSLLSVWRKEANLAEFEGFEFRMHGYHVRAHAKAKAVEVYAPDGAAAPGKGDAGEIKQLFAWAVANLSAAVPGDVKQFLAKFAK
jgi:hypothetical protein